MNYRNIFVISAVVILLAAGGVCVFAGGTDASSDTSIELNGVEPLKINSEGTIKGDYASWGATYSYDEIEQVATLSFSGNTTIDCIGKNYMIDSSVNLVIVLNGNLTLTSSKKVTDYDYSVINANGCDLTIKGPGSMNVICPNVDGGYSHIYCLDSYVFGSQSSIVIDHATVSITARDTDEIEMSGIHADSCKIIGSHLTVKTESGAKNNGNLYAIRASDLDIEGSIIDIEMKSYNCDGFRISAQDGGCTAENSFITIDVGGENASYGVYSVRCKFTNCDVTIISKGEHNSNGVNKFLAVDHSNVFIDSGTKAIKEGLNPGEDCELLDGDGKRLKNVKAFMELKKGTIHNLKVTTVLDPDGGIGFFFDDIVAPYGSNVDLPTFGLVKDGKVLVGWTDGYNTYREGDVYTPRISLTLTALYGEVEEEPVDNVMVTAACAILAVPVVAIIGMNFIVPKH